VSKRGLFGIIVNLQGLNSIMYAGNK
jgi:hypothetical protein